MKKALSLLLTLALLAGTFCTVVPMTASASAVSFTVTAGTVDAAFTGGGTAAGRVPVRRRQQRPRR